MSGLSNYFKNLNVCGDFRSAKIQAKENGTKYISPCDLNENLRIMDYIKNIPCRIKEFGCFVSHSFKKSWKLRFITLFLIILYCVNYYLIYTNQITSSNTNGGNAINSLYFTTTQISSVGFGDWTPSTGFAKICTSLANILVIFIAYSIAEEFGYITVAREMQTEEIKKNVKEDLAPLQIGLSPEIKETIKDNIIKKMSNAGRNNSFTEVVSINNSINKTESTIHEAKEKLLAKLQKNKIYPQVPTFDPVSVINN